MSHQITEKNKKHMVKENPNMNDCPCRSGAEYAACCEPIITGASPAETPERLMRARYSAYVRAEVDFLFRSTHPKHREGYDHKGTREWAESAEWLGLEILGTEQGGEGEEAGKVEFIARFKEKGVAREHHELAGFERENADWYFTEGSMVRPKPITVNKVGRNEPCSCGSGLKYKKCCGKCPLSPSSAVVWPAARRHGRRRNAGYG